MISTRKIYVAGHRGMVGSAIVRHLQSAVYTNLINHSLQEINLFDRRASFDVLQAEKPGE